MEVGAYQMMYALAKAEEDDTLNETTNKIDKFISILPCLYSNQASQDTLYDRQKWATNYMSSLEVRGENFFYGEGSNETADNEFACDVNVNLPCE
jgi:hypothetical protein